MRNGVKFNEATYALEQYDSVGAHIRDTQTLLWPGSSFGNVRTFWIYFEIALCLQSNGRILIRFHETHILHKVCVHLNVRIKVSESYVSLPEGQPVKFSVAEAVSSVSSRDVLQFSFFAALWCLYAGLVSPIGHAEILRFKRRHYKTLEKAFELFSANWSPPVHKASSDYQSFIDAAYSSPSSEGDWDTKLWKQAAVYNPWITKGYFDRHEASRIVKLLSPSSGTQISVRLFKTAFSHNSGPYTGMLGEPFVDALRALNIPADVAGTVDYDDLSATLFMLDIGDGT